MAERIRCSRCKRVKGPRSFSADTTRTSGRFPWCSLCVTRYRTENKFQNPEAPSLERHCPVCDTLLRGHKNRAYCGDPCKGKANGLRMKYGLSVEQYRAMIPADGRCPICRQRATLWNVDHNHRTLQIMGLVCTRCNVGALAGTFHDIEFVERLLDFLQNPPALALGIDTKANPEQIGPSKLREVWRNGRYAPRTVTPVDDGMPF